MSQCHLHDISEPCHVCQDQQISALQAEVTRLRIAFEQMEAAYKLAAADRDAGQAEIARLTTANAKRLGRFYSNKTLGAELEKREQQLDTLKHENKALLADKARLDWLQRQDSGTLKLAVYQNGYAEVNPTGEIANWFVGDTLRAALDAAREKE